MSNANPPSAAADLENEAAVELRVIIPLILSLGYSVGDIVPKPSVVFQEGRRGRRPEADFAVYAGPIRTPDTSLMVVEAKRPGEDADDARKQGESYAFALRAPFLLLCDGVELQIWQLQLTSTSELVFHCRVDEIEARRGELEALISRPAAIHYARELLSKSILDASADFGSYEKAEIARTQRFESAIERTLKEPQGSAEPSTQLLEARSQGALIVAGSGMGKTHLGYSLLRQAITARWVSADRPIAVHIPLQDVPAGETLIQFAQQRLEAHKPGFGAEPFRDLLRRHGAALICDAYDRLRGPRREAVAQEMRNLLRDFPKLQLFVLSRPSAHPHLPLPTLHLQPLSATEQEAFGRAYGVEYRAWSVPRILQSVLGNALLLRLTLDYRAAHDRNPTELSQLFSTWVDQSLDAEASPAGAGQRQEALMFLAAAGVDKPLTPSRARAALRAQDLDSALVDELLQAGALTENGPHLNFEHEALADYLRALTIARSPKEQALFAISSVSLESDSLFPVLLMSALEDGELQEALWKRLLGVSLSTYLAVLRFRRDLSEEFPSGEPDAVAQRYLAELLTGLEEPIDAFFPQIQAAVRGELAGAPASRLRILGHASAASVIYGLLPAQAGKDTVELGEPDGRWQVINLRLSGLRLDSGRLVGATRLTEAVLKVIERRDLEGGLAWREERLLGRLHYLAREYGFTFEEPIALQAVVDQLSPHADKAVVYTHGLGELYFDIAEPLADADALLEAGRTHVTRWWTFDDRSLVDGEFDEGALRELLIQLYERATRIYEELVKHSFAAIAAEMSFGEAQPVRWDLTVRTNPDRPHARTVLEAYCIPVDSPALAKPSVAFNSERVDIRAYFDLVQKELARLGRTRGMVWGSSQILFGFDEPRPGAAFDGQSPALRLACEWIIKDLKRLFNETPANDR